MSFKKEILAFYVLIIASTGIIIAADSPACKVVLNQEATPNQPVKCCNLKNQQTSPQSTPALYFTEGILRFRA
jgi:hypothetical protein